MNVYIDESGSINNHSAANKYFVIALVCVKEPKKLKRAYKRFVSSNYNALMELDRGAAKESGGKIRKSYGKMFAGGKFTELKGSQFNKAMKIKFLEYFTKADYFELYIIKLDNQALTDIFCKNTSRGFNYVLKLAVSYFIESGYWSNNEEYILQLDERNEKIETRYFLENYLNAELVLGGISENNFQVQYFDSQNNDLIQVADVFANIYYSNLNINGAYDYYFQVLKERNILKAEFEYPLE